MPKRTLVALVGFMSSKVAQHPANVMNVSLIKVTGHHTAQRWTYESATRAIIMFTMQNGYGQLPWSIENTLAPLDRGGGVHASCSGTMAIGLLRVGNRRSARDDH